MSVRLLTISFCSVLLLALLVSGYENTPRFRRKGMNHLESRLASIIMSRIEPNIRQIPTIWKKVTVQKKHNEITVPSQMSHLLGSLPTKSALASSTSDASFADSTINTKSSVVDQSQKYTESEENNYSSCGKVSKRFKRIVGGRSSRFGNHPWQVAMYRSNMPGIPYCGGVLISDRSIITAAHCLKNLTIETLTVRLGEYNIRESGEELPHDDYRIEEAEVHPEYSPFWNHNDLVILKLDRTVRFDYHIVPLCLPTGDLDLIGEKATVSGWGYRNSKDLTSQPAILNEVEVEIFPNKVCQRWFSNRGYRMHLDDAYLCAGDREGGRDACAGDSGGPLTISIDDRKVLIGIASWGIDCGRKRLAGIYVNIEKYVPWIKPIIIRQRRLIDTN